MPSALLGATNLDPKCTKPEDTALRDFKMFFSGVGGVVARLLSSFLNALQLYRMIHLTSGSSWLIRVLYLHYSEAACQENLIYFRESQDSHL